MAKRKYGVLRGKVVATAEEHDQSSPHYQVMIMANGTPWRIAVNIQSTDTSGGADKSIVLYKIDEDFRHPALETVKKFADGFTALPAGPDGGALDYIRGNLFDPSDMRLLPPDSSDGNDLNTVLDSHVQRAKSEQDAVIFSFGQPWGPENKPDKTFKFKPNQGVHDIHMNQGNPVAGGHAGDNGVWQDGGVLMWFPSSDRWVAIFLAFQSQSWHTDDRNGMPIAGSTGAEANQFDDQHRRLPDQQQAAAEAEIVAVRLKQGGGQGTAVMLLNTSSEVVDLSKWSVATSKQDKVALDGGLAIGATLDVQVPASFFRKGGGSLTLLDGQGLKVDGATYPASAGARRGWIKVA
ncbi:DUF2278 family protein [Mesorhizobium sp. 43Arga]